MKILSQDYSWPASEGRHLISEPAKKLKSRLFLKADKVVKALKTIHQAK